MFRLNLVKVVYKIDTSKPMFILFASTKSLPVKSCDQLLS